MSAIIMPPIDPPKPSLASKYYACDDPNRPVCRDFVNNGRCYRHHRCKFYHPKVITRVILKKATRELGHCYCGAFQRKIIKGNHESENLTFFVVCSSTGRSIKRCM